MSPAKITRRKFLEAATAGAILAACESKLPAMTPVSQIVTETAAPAALPSQTKPAEAPPEMTAQPSATVFPPAVLGQMPRRKLGKTGWELSMIGFGGIVVMNETDADAAMLVRQAIERGINYFDVAPLYGNAEIRLGPALEPYRQDVFLACKTQQRTRAEAAAELERSLERARTDHFDLYQFHAVSDVGEADAILGPGGALEAALEAREAGKVKHIGFSAHSEEAALAMLDRFQFDTILYPVSWVTWYAGNFGPRVVQKAEEQGLGILALKSLARRPWPAGASKNKWNKCWYEPVDTPEDALLGLRFTLSKPVTAAVPPGHAELLWLACDALPKYTPLSGDEEAQLAERAREYQPLFSG